LRVTRRPRRTDTFRWRLAIGAILIAGGYGPWLIIPFVVGVTPHEVSICFDYNFFGPMAAAFQPSSLLCNW